jgi:predicted amidophosphoribosyltransferase
VTLDINTLRPRPAGFGQCADCAYQVASGRAEICYSCALTVVKAARGTSTCKICEHPLHDDRSCHNPTCARSDRMFGWNRAFGVRAGVLEDRLIRYKFHDKRGWATIFGRIFVGFLDDYRSNFEEFDLIIASPSYTGAGAARDWDHIRLILEEAADANGDRWKFDLDSPPAVIKTGPTSPLSRAGSYKRRREIAETEIRQSLAVPDPAKVSTKRILVFDDVFTDGLTLQEVARALRREGAKLVCGVSIARAIYKGQAS